jgi:2,3,4,5-tetrahydropyridine-2-carboxylate N-succinyltransferase
LSVNAELRNSIERLFDLPSDRISRKEAIGICDELRNQLNRGTVRAAEPRNGEWHVNVWVKKGILLAFRIGRVQRWDGQSRFPFYDKDTMPVRTIGEGDGIRIVPGGSAIRDGAFIGNGVVMMPPSYVNIGAYVDAETMIDSHALVGSCAQVGRRVHLSAAAQIGGVLEPVGSVPVVVEDDAFIGGNCGIYEGTCVRRGAVIASGVILTGSTPVYDLVRETIYRKENGHPLTIPEHAVVISGNRPIDHPFAAGHHLSMYTPVIIKYRDARTDAATTLEESLR